MKRDIIASLRPQPSSAASSSRGHGRNGGYSVPHLLDKQQLMAQGSGTHLPSENLVYLGRGSWRNEMRGTRIATFALAVAATASLVRATPAGPAPGESLSQSYRGSQSRNVEYQKIAPFKVMDNVYYVGPGSVSVWLPPPRGGRVPVDKGAQ